MNTINLSPEFCSHNGTVILSSSEDTILIGMLDVENQVLRTRIEKAYPGINIRFECIDVDSFKLKLSRLFSEDTLTEELVSRKKKLETPTHFIIDKIENDAPLVNLLNSIFLEAISLSASDIHIETESEDTQVRFRIDGLLVPIIKISLEKSLAVSARLKLLANLNVLENRRPQDGRIDIIFDGYSLDVRISITPTVYGESIVLRLLNRTDTALSLEELGFNKIHLSLIEKILELKSGLVLVSGPTGSGKTTTLAALLRELNKSEIKIITIEDPVENRIKGITQIQTNDEIGLSFETYLRRIFRQDPDIIMIGEIRDIETAELAIRAAMTGHLVFATIHTNTALEATVRLGNMGIPSYLISSVLRSVIGQRLLRRICTVCLGKGCSHCSKTGYKGRIVVSEIVILDSLMAEKIAEGKTSADLKKQLEIQKFYTIQDDAKAKVAEQITTLDEVKREFGGQW